MEDRWMSGVLGRTLWLMASLTLLATMLVVNPPSTTAAERSCTVDDLEDTVPEHAVIVSAEMVDEPVVHCRVDGYVTTDDPGPNEVNFMVALPDDHNGRYYYVGLGGTAGFVPDPPAEVIGQGYAVAGSDTGNRTGQTGSLDWTIMGDEAMALDHDHRGAHVTTVAAQDLTKAYYGTDTLFRYHVGCSGGARMALNAGILYPDDYDGLVVGAIGRDLGNMLHFGKVAQHLAQNPEGALDPSALRRVGARILEDWDAADGALDEMIWDPAVVEYTDDEIDALFEDFSDAQRATVDLIAGGYDLGGAAYQPEYPLSSIHLWDTWMSGFPHQVFGTWSIGAFGDDYDFVEDFDFTSLAHEEEFLSKFDGLQFGRSYEAWQLKDFQDAGGKLVMEHGVHDNVISWQNAPDLYDGIISESGGLHAAQEWARLFPVPGISHCAGGDGPQDVPLRALEAVANWVENDVPPEHLVAERPSDGRTFLLCPYPQASIFRGGLDNLQGLDVNDASTWDCQTRTPVADAGGPYAINRGDEVILDGSGSSHPAGVELEHLWELGELSDDGPMTGEVITVTPDGVGEFEVELTVTAEDGGTDTDTATITVTEAAAQPVCDVEAPAGFADLVDGPHAANVRCMAGFGIIQGGTDGTFNPSGDLRRDQMASLLQRTLQVGGVELPEVSDSGWDDVTGGPHETAIGQLTEVGVVLGTDDGVFDASRSVTRAQMASLLVRMLEFATGDDLSAPPSPFVDVAGSVHAPAIDVAYDLGITSGRTDTIFAPSSNVRRDQSGSFLGRAVQVMADEGLHLTPIG